MSRPKAVGIDLGTTNSAVAWVDDAGRTRMVGNAEGELLTPSVVLFDDSEVVVGKEARSATVANPERVAVWVKRDMGAPVYSRPIRGEYLPPEVIQACILRKLKADIVHSLGSDFQAVITVPAYFDELRRKATADAGEMAGLTVLDIVNEPTAGALAFGEMMGYLSADNAAKHEMNVLVYDLGGGTFDVTLLKLSPGNVRTLATDGDVQLGGYDWDLRVLNYVADAYTKAHGVDPRQDPRAVSRLFQAAAEAKHTLTARSQTSVRLEHNGLSVEVPLSRQKFEELTADLLERTSYTTRQLLAAAKFRWKDVSRVLLVGGSTRMPMVGRMLQELSGLVPDHTVNPDEAVARGAALYANYLLRKTAAPAEQPAFQVTNVNAHSLGVEGVDPQTMRKTNVILIPRNTPLPATKTERFMTKSDSQRSIVLQVLEGESSLPGECTAIGRTVIRDIPPGLPKGWPIDVKFEYGSNGRLTIHAVVTGVNKEVQLDLERDRGLSQAGVERWKQTVTASGGFNKFDAMLDEVLGAAPAGFVPAIGAKPGAASLATASAPAPAPRAAQPAAAQVAPAATPTALPQPAPMALQAPMARAALPEEGPSGLRVPRWVISMCGHILAGLLGLAVAYLIMAHFQPHRFPLPW